MTIALFYSPRCLLSFIKRINSVMRGLHLFTIVLTLIVPASTHARELRRTNTVEERLIARCIHASSRGKPWLEKTLWGLRDQEGGWIGAEVRNDDGTHDLGPMQINSRWVPRMSRMLVKPPQQVRRWLRDDPCFNVEAARWLLLTGLAASSDYWMAIGIYHSPSTTRRNQYIASVARRLRWRFAVAIR